MSTDKKESVSATFPPDLLTEIDERAKQLDMNRSQYLRHLARKDLEAARTMKQLELVATEKHHEEAA